MQDKGFFVVFFVCFGCFLLLLLCLFSTLAALNFHRQDIFFPVQAMYEISQSRFGSECDIRL